MTPPTAATIRQQIESPDSFYLEDFKPYKPSAKGNPQRWYWNRKNDIQPRIIVLHTAENRTDLVGNDSGAENVARYFATGGRDVSIHSCTDSDSIVMCLKDERCAWHVAGFNTISVGVEMCLRSRDWADVPGDYRRGVIDNTARVCAHWCLKHSIPTNMVTRQQVKNGHSGIAYHSILDPEHRSDPGVGFPVEEFLTQLDVWVDRFDRLKHAPPPPPPVPTEVAPSLKLEFERAVKLGLTDGSRPNEPATRAEAAVMAIRAAGL